MLSFLAALFYISVLFHLLIFISY